jgi:hypothetical protein
MNKLHAICQQVDGESLVCLYDDDGTLWQAHREHRSHPWIVRRGGKTTGEVLTSTWDMPSVLERLGGLAKVDLS